MNMCSMPFPACASELNCDVLPEEKLHFISQINLAILSEEDSQISVLKYSSA